MSYGKALAISVKNGYTIPDKKNASPWDARQEGLAVSEEFGPEFITVTDEDGNDIELELVDVLEHNGRTYMAFFPALLEDVDEDSDDYGLVILKSIQENGEELLSTLDSEEELTEVYERFMEELFEDEEE